MTVRWLYSSTLCAKALSPLWDINLTKVSCLCFSEMCFFIPLFYLSIITN